ncbi:SHPS1 phosphatase, partial [Polypterus senegalus]|nr:SHPS1 phosphatase [Polypterus senegalus]
MPNLSIVLTCLICLPIGRVCQGVNVSQPQGSVEAREGNTVILICVMSSDTPLGPVRWYKGNGSERTHFYSPAPKAGDKNDPRVTWTVENLTVNYSITIRDLRISDTGEYYCEKYTKADENKVYATGPGVNLTVTGGQQSVTFFVFMCYLKFLIFKNCLLTEKIKLKQMKLPCAIVVHLHTGKSVSLCDNQCLLLFGCEERKMEKEKVSRHEAGVAGTK